MEKWNETIGVFEWDNCKWPEKPQDKLSSLRDAKVVGAPKGVQLIQTLLTLSS